MNNKIIAIFYAFIAAVFYAVNVPFSKILLENVSPTFMAALLYIGAGIGVGIMYLFTYKKEDKSARLERSDMPFTIGMILLDIIAPVLLMIGIKTGTASNASLLGNFEIVATSVIAFLLFKEKISKKLWTAVCLITLSSIILSFGGTSAFRFSLGSVFVLGATVCWGLENNCTRKISEKSTYQIVTLKGLGSGTGSLIVAFIIGESFPNIKFVLPVLVLGYVAYGLSIFTYVRAQKTLGAAKTSAYYAVAPFIGAFLSFVFLKEELTKSYLTALLIMVAGTILVISDTLVKHHSHEHTHTYTYTQNGLTRTYTFTHSHEHNHYTHNDIHNHRHKLPKSEN